MWRYVGSFDFKAVGEGGERFVFEDTVSSRRLAGRPQAFLNADLAAALLGDGDHRGPRRHARP